MLGAFIVRVFKRLGNGKRKNNYLNAKIFFPT